MEDRTVAAMAHVTRAGDSEEPLVTLGRQVRTVRMQPALSMQGLAEAAGISRVWLGEIERGAASPSVGIVRRLADALGVSIGSLLDSRAAHSVATIDVEAQGGAARAVRASERISIKFPSQPFSWELLTLLQGNIQLMQGQLERTHDAIGMMEHRGQEVVLVLLLAGE